MKHKQDLLSKAFAVCWLALFLIYALFVYALYFAPHTPKRLEVVPMDNGLLENLLAHVHAPFKVPSGGVYFGHLEYPLVGLYVRTHLPTNMGELKDAIIITTSYENDFDALLHTLVHELAHANEPAWVAVLCHIGAVYPVALLVLIMLLSMTEDKSEKLTGALLLLLCLVFYVYISRATIYDFHEFPSEAYANYYEWLHGGSVYPWLFFATAYCAGLVCLAVAVVYVIK